jgi:NitT/TauT family transport system substrate-binding protein
MLDLTTGRALAAAATIAIAGMTLTGCGSTGTSAQTSPAYNCSAPNADTMTDISIVAMPILSSASLFVGIDEGIFKKNGLNPTVEMVSSPPAGVSALMGGNADFAFTTTVNLLQAVDQGQKIKGVTAFAGIEPGYWEKMQAGEKGYTTGINALLVQKDSGIQNPGDLEGKTVAVQDPIFSTMMTKALVKAHGGDPEKVRYVIMPAADSYQAIRAGKIDAAQTAEPFIQGWEDTNLRNLSWAEVEVFHDGPMSFMVATEDYIEKNADTVARFGCAISEASAFSNKNPDRVREATARKQGVDPASLAKAVVPHYFTDTDTEGVQRVQTKMKEFNFLTSDLSLGDFLAGPALPAKDSK